MPLWFALCLLGSIAFVMGSCRTALTAAALLLNWCVCAAYYRLTGDQYPWLVLATVDLVSGCAILAIPFSDRHETNKWQVYIAATYLFGLGWHAWYGFAGASPWSQYHYWYAMHYMAWAQLWAVVGWTGYEIVGLARRGGYPWRSLLVRWRSAFEASRW